MNMDIKAVINEEVKKLFENLEVYTIPQLAQMLANVKLQYQNSIPFLEKILWDEYKKNGDAGVEKAYAKMSGVEIESLRNGRYVFANLGGGSQPHYQTIRETLQGTNVKEKQDVLRHYIDILKATDGDNHELAITYFIILINFLDIEQQFSAEVQQAGKQLNANLNVEPLEDVDAVYKKFLELYDNHSKVRFAVETFDSVEPIRIYLQDHPEVYKELSEGVSEDLFESIERELKDVLQRGDIDEVEDNANHMPDEMPYIMEDLP